ncbi:MAG: addiction module toxin RelE [Cytophagales bacterium]|nr:MAG: addiction module toxin RelE [Cytophagales bacterium]
MSINVSLLSRFRRDLKRLGKKHRTLVTEVDQLLDLLESDPTLGQSLGSGLYKIRLASQSKGKGKRGGFRVVTYYVEQVGDEEVVYLVTIYDKSEQDSVSKDDLLAMIDDAFGE